MFISLSSYIFNQKFFINFIIFFILFWLVSIFIFIAKRSKFKFVVIDQRFWKRSLGLFWILEVSLFCIYIYLWLFSPSEYILGFDNSSLFIPNSSDFVSYFKGLCLIFFLVLLGVGAFFQKLYNKVSVLIYLIGTALLFLIFFLDDIYQTFFILNSYVFEIFQYNTEFYYWEFSTTKLKSRTSVHYIFLLTVLKFWHLFFIAIVLFLSLGYVTFFKQISFDTISIHMLHVLFIFGFFFIFYLSILKDFIKFFLKNPFHYLFFTKYFV